MLRLSDREHRPSVPPYPGHFRALNFHPRSSIQSSILDFSPMPLPLKTAILQRSFDVALGRLRGRFGGASALVWRRFLGNLRSILLPNHRRKLHLQKSPSPGTHRNFLFSLPLRETQIPASPPSSFVILSSLVIRHSSFPPPSPLPARSSILHLRSSILDHPASILDLPSSIPSSRCPPNPFPLPFPPMGLLLSITIFLAFGVGFVFINI